MNQIVRKFGMMGVVVAVGSLASGCMGGVSLFSSSHVHTHYEGKPGLEERVKTLEARVEALEATVQISPVSEVN